MLASGWLSLVLLGEPSEAPAVFFVFCLLFCQRARLFCTGLENKARPGGVMVCAGGRLEQEQPQSQGHGPKLPRSPAKTRCLLSSRLCLPVTTDSLLSWRLRSLVR